MVREHRAYLFTRVIYFQHVLATTKALTDVCVKMISIVHPYVVKMIICFGWKFHEILLNTVYLRKLCDVDAVDVRVLHNVFNVSHCGAQTSFRMPYVSAFLQRLLCKLFWTKIVRCYNCTVNFYSNLFRNKNLDLTMGLFLKYCPFSYLIVVNMSHVDLHVQLDRLTSLVKVLCHSKSRL